MKNTIVRLSVLALVATGFAASTVSSQTSKKQGTIKPVVIATTVPAPVCPMGDPTHCGLH